MANKKISDLVALTGVLGTDKLVALDSSDITEAKSVTVTELFTSPEITTPTIVTPTITLKQGSAPTPTDEGDIQWDTDDNKLVIGDGSGQKSFSDDTASLTNKPLTTPKITTSINDANGNEVIKTPATASAVNEITVTNAATGGTPQISATGDDTNIHLDLRGKANGLVKISVLKRDATTNTYQPSSVILCGITASLGTIVVGGNAVEAVTFGITFAAVPIVITAPSGSTGAPTAGAYISSIGDSKTTSGFNLRVGNAAGGGTSGAIYGEWIAIGTL